MVLYNNMLQSLFSSQIQTLGVVMLGIALMLMLLFRSISLALIGIIPNILAAGLILGLMGILGIPLDMMSITIAAITIGIAVDNSIHYIYRFREEYSGGRGYLPTLHYCHANIGRAVFLYGADCHHRFFHTGIVQFHTDHLLRTADCPGHVRGVAGSPDPAAQVDIDVPSVLTPRVAVDVPAVELRQRNAFCILMTRLK